MFYERLNFQEVKEQLSYKVTDIERTRFLCVYLAAYQGQHLNYVQCINMPEVNLNLS